MLCVVGKDEFGTTLEPGTKVAEVHSVVIAVVKTWTHGFGRRTLPRVSAAEPGSLMGPARAASAVLMKRIAACSAMLAATYAVQNGGCMAECGKVVARCPRLAQALYSSFHRIPHHGVCVGGQCRRCGGQGW